MKKEWMLCIVLGLVLISSVSLVNASWLSDTIGKITGKVTSTPTTGCTINSDGCVICYNNGMNYSYCSSNYNSTEKYNDYSITFDSETDEIVFTITSGSYEYVCPIPLDELVTVYNNSSAITNLIYESCSLDNYMVEFNGPHNNVTLDCELNLNDLTSIPTGPQGLPQAILYLVESCEASSTDEAITNYFNYAQCAQEVADMTPECSIYQNSYLQSCTNQFKNYTGMTSSQLQTALNKCKTVATTYYNNCKSVVSVIKDECNGYKNCPSGQIYNPSTKKCINVAGIFGSVFKR
jgi:hypothetical protein